MLLVLFAATVPVQAEQAGGSELNNQGVRAAQAGRFEEAVKTLREAAALSPADLQVRQNLSGILTDWAARLQEEGRFDEAASALREALANDSSNAKTLLLLGNLAYASEDDLASAVSFWKKALPGAPSSHRQGLLQKISQAERDLSIERGFEARQTEHFHVRFEGSPPPENSGRLTAVLEEEYGRLNTALGTGPARIGVIVYAGDSFKRIAGRQDWTLGLYDGRIRLRLEDIGTEWMAPILAHELAHAFLREEFGPRIPVWVHEGYAQASEPARPAAPREAELEKAVASRSAWVPLKWLDRRFQQPSHLDDVEKAYAQSKWAVSELLRRFGHARFRKFLEGLAARKTVEQAFNSAFAPLTWSRADAGSFD
ncbi:MAG: hypothetical protein HYZ94_02575 [Candidatus Omnitrophica bacterium]|nr:hypothetical protein [Candidatus Omnitrophota bacterium]